MLLQVQTHRLIRDRELRKRAGTLAHRHLATLSVHKTDVGFDVVRPCCWAVSVETVENVEPESAPYSVFLPVLRKSTNEVYKHRPAALIKSRTLCFFDDYISINSEIRPELWSVGTWPAYKFIRNEVLKAVSADRVLPQIFIFNEVIRLPRSAPPSRRPLQGIYPALFAGFLLPNHSHFILTDFDVIDIGEAGF